MRNLAERQILKAKAEGQLEGLEGAGKPLPKHPERAMIDMADEVGHRIMAEAGALPDEVRLKKALDAARATYAKAGPNDRPVLMRQIAELELRFNIAQEARKKFLSR